MSNLRYNDFRQIVARFDSIGKCGHSITKGDPIGYARGIVYCPDCWSKWTTEVREENFLDDQYNELSYSD